MILRKKVGPRGQIVIPKIIRDFLGIKPGSEVLIEVRSGELVIRPSKYPEEFLDELCSVIEKKLAKKIDLKSLLEEEVEERIALRGL